MVSEDVEKAIDAANQRFVEGFVKGEPSISAAVYAEDSVVFPPDAAMVRGKKAIEEFWGSVMASGVKGARLTTEQIVGSGEYVQERGTGILEVRPAGEPPAEQKIKYVVVWKRTADGWKNLWDIWNSSP